MESTEVCLEVVQEQWQQRVNKQVIIRTVDVSMFSNVCKGFCDKTLHIREHIPNFAEIKRDEKN
jgi:hypothetical protein